MYEPFGFNVLVIYALPKKSENEYDSNIGL